MAGTPTVPQAGSRRKVGRPKKSESTVRIQATVPTSLHHRMIELQEAAFHGSVSDMLCAALTFYVENHEEHKKGGKLLFKREGEPPREILTFL